MLSLRAVGIYTDKQTKIQYEKLYCPEEKGKQLNDMINPVRGSTERLSHQSTYDVIMSVHSFAEQESVNEMYYIF